MKRIFKYELNQKVNEIELHKGAVVLHVESQHGITCLWGIVDTDKPKEVRYFHIILTGGEVTPPGLKYVGTVLKDNGYFVQHVFEEVVK